MSRGERPVIFGDGEQTRDFNFISNAVEANLRALTCDPSAAGGSYNIACGARISLLDLVASLNRILGTDIQPVHADARPGDVKHSLADVAAAGEKLGYRPSVPFQEGLAQTAAWFRKKT